VVGRQRRLLVVDGVESGSEASCLQFNGRQRLTLGSLVWHWPAELDRAFETHHGAALFFHTRDLLIFVTTEW